MLNSLSWLDFLYGTVVVIGGYYTLAALFTNVKRIAHRSSIESTSLNIGDESPSNMMGLTKPEFKASRNNSTVSSNQVTIAPEEVQDQLMEIAVQVGPSVSDLLQEIKVLTKNIQDNKGTEAESVPMYKALIQRNAHLASGPYKEVINKFLHDQVINVCGFQIDISEIRLWWSNNY